ncbi:major capsid protein [Delftia sp. WSY_14]|uniref:major capsid protein n=1 Tax=unclassified Delftia TaxID=2613839 RepID=UPI00370BF614
MLFTITAAVRLSCSVAINWKRASERFPQASRAGFAGADSQHRFSFQLEFYMFEKTFSVARKYGTRVAAVPAVAIMAMGNAHAVLPTEVETALGSLSTDALKVAGIVLAAIVAVYAFKFIRKGL